MTRSYLEKIKKDDKIILGKGGFGQVRLALGLFISPGDLICIKKTQSFFVLAPKSGEMIPSALQRATESTLKDYLARGVADKVYAPQILDMALITDPKVNTEANEMMKYHQKGYLMMEMYPQKTAKSIFEDPKYQLWSYQKPFLRDILISTSDLLKERIAFTDLKPENALFDPDTFKTAIIDLGGTIKIADTDSLENIERRKYSYDWTQAYCAPEMKGTSGKINLHKALAYICGKVIEEITEKGRACRKELDNLIAEFTQETPETRTSIEGILKKFRDCPDWKALDHLITKLTSEQRILIEAALEKFRDCPDCKALDNLITKLTHETPDQRISIERALEILKGIGDDASNEEILLIQYINNMKHRINNNRSSVSLNEDIFETKKTFIDLKITARDPERTKDQVVEDLFIRIDSFLAAAPEEQQVMAIFGSAGSGKSIALQLKFIESIKNWGKSKPVPIYFNLANGIDLKTIMNGINAELGTNLNIQTLENKIQLYIDSFDEGLGIEKTRETLIREYLTKMKQGQTKILITCRSNYLESDSCTSWFTPQANAFDKLVIGYIAPLNYIAKSHSDKLHWQKNVADYVAQNNQKLNDEGLKLTTEEIISRMANMNLDKIIDTGLMFRIAMEVLPDLLQIGDASRSKSRQEIYLRYVIKFQQRKLELLTNEEQKHQIAQDTKFLSNEKELIKTISALGKYLAVQLHLKGIFRLDQDASILKVLGYQKQIPMKKQTLWHILKLLPLKVETKSNKDMKQEVKVGFIHDTFKNSYLLAAIQDELNIQSGRSSTLESKSIISDMELIKFIADAALHDLKLKDYLRKAIDFTKSDNKNERAAIYAANCVTVLVSARHSFAGQDLSNVNIKGANLKNGVFSGANFSGANLNQTNLTNIQASHALFHQTELHGAKIGILPALQGHTDSVSSVSFSHDGKYLASGSHDNTVKIWEVQKNKCISTLKGHTSGVSSVSFSHDGKYLASGSDDNTVKIWEVQKKKYISTLQGHTNGVNCVSFSHDGKYLASGSDDKTVKIWEVQKNECISTLLGHTNWVSSVSFSHDGKYLASGSHDETVKIWEVQKNECISTLQGHTSSVFGVSFSHDGKYLASGSGDKTVKIWEVQKNECISTLQGHTDWVSSVSFSHDGKYLASGSGDETVKIWEVQKNECISTLQGHTSSVFGVSFSHDGKYLASGSIDNTVKIWECSEYASNLPDLQGHTNGVKCVSFSHDGKYLASGSGDYTVKIWEVQKNECISTLQGHTLWVSSVSFSHDGKYLASGSGDKTVKIWEVQKNECISTLQGHTSGVKSVSFSHDGKYLASGSHDETVKIWEVQKNECISTLLGHTDRVSSVSFSHDGKYLASGSGDETVKIWEVQNNKCISTLQGHTLWVSSVSFSHDGKYLASGSGDNTVKIWEVQKNKCISTLKGHTDWVSSVSFSHDGKYLASGSDDNTVKIWEVQKKKYISTLQGHTNGVNCVSFSHDGKYLASGSSNKSIQIWSHVGDQWLLENYISNFEPALNLQGARLLDTSMTSDRNQRIFQQRGARVKNNKTSTEFNEKMKASPDFSLELAERQNKQLLASQTKASSHQEVQKMHMMMPKEPIEQNSNKVFPTPAKMEHDIALPHMKTTGTAGSQKSVCCYVF